MNIKTAKHVIVMCKLLLILLLWIVYKELE